MGIKRQNLSSGRVILLIVYTIAIIYFMFFGFGRPQINDTLTEYRFSILFTGIPLWFPKSLSLVFSKLWIFSLGNLLAFVPFGILIPMVLSTKYYKFIFIFLISILSLEILQMVTYLGSFDIEDIIVNSLGATIGYFAYKIGNKSKSRLKKIMSTIVLILIFSFMLIVFAEIFNKVFDF
ncbi:glycopeptide antibiotics resistance protein [Mobilisporobacter senegalensis]|uniref:Glycopeptide antibiotics resistance protein n=1 Tax=Mobilisporobacter senegalensis TaxID=1329262 RepID=A0A3N1XIA2_9FIRM|nr:VanZ family protein [Mobilisporobacter senegalensis]ROR25818.1 glycopeptide antibiotics resistance protein [Mobilisporobacter senegalensis]